MGFLSRIPILGHGSPSGRAASPPKAPGHPLAHPGGHQIRALAGAGQRNCKRPGCTSPITGTHLQLCAGHEDEYLDLFLDSERES